MKQMLKRLTILSFVFLLTAGTVQGCSISSGGDKAWGSDQTPADMPPVQKDGKHDPPVTITTVMTVSDDVKFKDGETYDNNVHTRWAHDKLGIDIKYLWTVKTIDDYNNKLKLMFAGNEPLPDVMFVNDDQILSNFIESGKLMDIKSVWDQYAPERVKAAYAAHPEVWSKVKRGDKIYGIPFTLAGSIPRGIVWYRQDWLDKYNLEVPTTFEEFEHVMETFVKNGPKGTIGLTLGMNNPSGPASGWISTAIFVFAAYGNYIPDQWNKAEDGTLVYGSIQPSVKQAFAKLAEWFRKGYLDPEIASLDEVEALDSISREKSGIIAGPDWTPGWPSFEAIPGFSQKFVSGFYPTGADGRRIGLTGPEAGPSLVFSKDFEHFDAFMSYFDKVVAPYPADSEFIYGYAEGYDYIMEDGKPIFRFDGKVDVQKYLLTNNARWLPPGNQELISRKKLLEGGQPTDATDLKNAARMEDMRNQYVAGVQSLTLMEDLNARIIKNEFSGPPTKTMVARWEFLKKVELDTFTKIIYGQLPLDAFDQFVKDWKANGGDEITKEVNEWYQSQGKS
jgi:putative aldouronate transport system substrate-binding protein